MTANGGGKDQACVCAGRLHGNGLKVWRDRQDQQRALYMTVPPSMMIVTWKFMAL